MQPDRSRLSRTARYRIAAISIVVVGGLLFSQTTIRETELPSATVVQTQLSLDVQRLANRIIVIGSTVSAQHEADLIAAIKAAFPTATLHYDFLPYGLAPDHWARSSIALIDAIQDIESAQFRLSPDRVDIKVLTHDEKLWQERVAQLHTELPHTLKIESSFMPSRLVHEHGDICERATKTFTTDRIRFVEASAEFLSSAYPLLDRILELANHCIDTRIIVTGHTDSSGDEKSNRRLSKQRAQAVADYFVVDGVSPERTIVVGAGSDHPIATNATRYGRRLNRRIDIEFASVSPAP